MLIIKLNNKSFFIYNSNKYQEAKNMQKINIGLFGLLIIFLLVLYQNFKIIHYNNELQSSIDNLNLLVEDLHNDVHELIK